MVRSRDRCIADRRVHRRDGFLQKDRRRREDNRHRAPRANLEGGYASATARRGALTGGQSHRHRGVGRDGGAQRPAGASPAGFFGAAVITQPAEKIPPEVQAQRTATYHLPLTTYVHERRRSRWVLSTLPRPFPTLLRTSLPSLRT